MKYIFVLLVAVVLLTGCSNDIPNNVIIVGQGDNASIDVVGQVDSDKVDSTIGNTTANVTVSLVSVYDVNLSGFEQVDTYTYGNSVFVRDASGLWITEIYDPNVNNLFVIILNYDPLNIQNVSIDGNITEFYQLMASYNASTFVTFDPFDDSEALAVGYLELSEALGEVGVSIVPAISKEAVNATLPVVDCNGQTPVIKLLNAGEASVSYNNACLTISGTEAELVKAVDRFIWNFYGVMN